MTDGPVMVNGQPNPTGTGRYCMPSRCHCTKCPGYPGQKAMADRAYERELEKARAQNPNRRRR
jgi:hypothetical protein